MADERLAARQRLPDLDLEPGREGERGEHDIHRAIELVHALDRAQHAQVGQAQVLEQGADRTRDDDLDRQQRAAQIGVGHPDEVAEIDGVDAVAPTHDAKAQHAIAARGRQGGAGGFGMGQGADRARGQAAEEFRLLVLDGPDDVGAVEGEAFLVRRGVEVFRRDPLRRQKGAAIGEAVMGVEDAQHARGRVLQRLGQPRVVHQQRVVAAHLEQPVEHLPDRGVPPFVGAVVLALGRAGVQRAGDGAVEDLVPLRGHLGEGAAGQDGAPFLVRGVVQQPQMRAFGPQRPVHLQDAVAVPQGRRPGRHRRDHQDAQPVPGAAAARLRGHRVPRAPRARH